MSDISTRHFGVISYDECAVIRFPQGLPAFETAQRFLLVERPATSPFVFLQSLDFPDLFFVSVPVMALDPGYELGICLEDLQALELDQTRQPSIGAEIECLAIVSAPNDCPATANLLAPIAINTRTRTAVQAIRVDSRYSHQHVLTPAGASCS